MGQGRRRMEEKWAILTLGFCWVFKKYQNDTIWHVDGIKKRVGNLGLGQKIPPDKLEERKGGDSNPRRLITLHDFQSCTFDHSDTFPISN